MVILVGEPRLESFGAVPFRHGALKPLLADYRRPNDKIAEWLRSGDLLALKRGLYVLGPQRRQEPVSLPLVANLLYGPSCVSLDYALYWHGLIPERVYEVTSVCLRRSRVFDNELGRFSYTTVPQSLFAVGVQRESVGEQVSFLMASPEKALCDKLLLTRHFRIQGASAMRDFLLQDLRVDEEALGKMDLSVVRAYADSGHKTRQMAALRAVLEEGL